MKLAILTSGGDAPGMNAAIRSIVLSAHHFGFQTVGFYHGYNGLIQNESINLIPANVQDIISKGGTILKSARCPQMQQESGLEKAKQSLINNDIDALIVIGGDGSFRGLNALSHIWSGLLIGIPGTIDNDIAHTDFTIGFSTAVNTAINAIDKIRDTANAFDRVFMVELMGRHSGHIAYNVGLACAAEKVISFENFSQNNAETEIKKLGKQIAFHQSNHQHSFLIVIAENIWPDGSIKLSKLISKESNIECTVCTLGHIQRGGSPVAKDRIMATKMGVSAVKLIKQGKTMLMTADQNNQIVAIPIEDAISDVSQVNSSVIEAQEDLLTISESDI